MSRVYADKPCQNLKLNEGNSNQYPRDELWKSTLLHVGCKFLNTERTSNRPFGRPARKAIQGSIHVGDMYVEGKRQNRQNLLSQKNLLNDNAPPFCSTIGISDCLRFNSYEVTQEVPNNWFISCFNSYSSFKIQGSYVQVIRQTLNLFKMNYTFIIVTVFIKWLCRIQ